MYRGTHSAVVRGERRRRLPAHYDAMHPLRPNYSCLASGAGSRRLEGLRRQACKGNANGRGKMKDWGGTDQGSG